MVMQTEIEYKGTKILVNSDGTIIWNNSIRKHHYNHDGYPVVSILTEDGWRQIGVARLFALAFIPNPNNLPEVNHKNYDRKDYSIDNLEWISHADNVRHSVCNKPDMHGVNNPNYGNTRLSEYYKLHPEEAKLKQGRPGKQNGRYIHGKYCNSFNKCNDYPVKEYTSGETPVVEAPYPC